MDIAFESMVQSLQDSYKPEVMQKIRKLAIQTGIPSHLRSLIWKLLLQTPQIDVNYYCSLVQRGPSEHADKIQKDTYRTFTGDLLFKEKVPEEKLIRVLNATIHHRKVKYVQGMNILLGPIIYVMNEPEAFFSFQKLLDMIPAYISPNLVGPIKGCQLIDQIIQRCEPQLFERLRSQKLSAQIYCFAEVMTCCAGLPGLNNCLRLWDALLSMHMGANVLFNAATMIKLKPMLMESNSCNDVINAQKSLIKVEDQLETIKKDMQIIIADRELMEQIRNHVLQ